MKMKNQMDMKQIGLSIVIRVYNEQENLPLMYSRSPQTKNFLTTLLITGR